MASRGAEVEVVEGGSSTEGATRGAFVKNMAWWDGSWEVRKGFGARAELDSLMNSYNVNAASTSGYQRHLGSTLIKTSWGHEQIVSILLADVSTGGSTNNVSSALRSGSQTAKVHDRGVATRLFVCSIYDLATDERWEEPFYHRTSEVQAFADSGPSNIRKVGSAHMRDLHGVYATNMDQDYQSWIGGVDEDVTFHFVDNTLFISSKTLGVWCYFPVHFYQDRQSTNVPMRNGRVEDHLKRHAASYREECPFLQPMVMCPGTIGVGVDEDLTYLNDAGLIPAPRSFHGVTSVSVDGGPSLVLAGNRDLFISLANELWSFPEDYVVPLMLRGTPTAVASFHGAIFVFGEGETWVYEPSQGATPNVGSWVNLSETVGCVGPNAVAVTHDVLAWIDSDGVYIAESSTSIKRISDPIDSYFTDYASDPSLHYFQDSGYTALSDDQPRMNLSFDPFRAHLAFSETLGALFVVSPLNGEALYFSDGRWAFWSFRSSAYTSGGSPAVGTLGRLNEPFLLGSRDGLYMVAGLLNATISNSADKPGSDYGAPNSDAYTILEYGRGGALDHSIEHEDYRSGGSSWVKQDAQSNAAATSFEHFIVYGEPIPIESRARGAGVFDYPAVSVAASAEAGDFLVPVYIYHQLTSQPGRAIVALVFEFEYDNALFEPIMEDPGGPSSGRLAAVFPPETQGFTASDWTIRCYEDTTFAVVSETGPAIKGSFGAGGYLPAPPYEMTLMCYLPFRAKRTSLSTFGMGVRHYRGFVNDALASVDHCGGIAHHRTDIVGAERWVAGAPGDLIERPVDWCYCSAPLVYKSNVNAKLRSLFMRLKSHGLGSHKVVDNWWFGLMNVIFSADWRGWASQVRDIEGATKDDWSGVEAVNGARRVRTVRDRAEDTTGSLTTPSFAADGATDGFRWGSTNPVTDATIDNKILAGDVELAEVAVSDSVKGQWFRVMMFGFMQNKAESLVLESATASLVWRGGRRRRYGHAGGEAIGSRPLK